MKFSIDVHAIFTSHLFNLSLSLSLLSHAPAQLTLKGKKRNKKLKIVKSKSEPEPRFGSGQSLNRLGVDWFWWPMERDGSASIVGVFFSLDKLKSLLLACSKTFFFNAARLRHTANHFFNSL
jgi:hypothetical protein